MTKTEIAKVVARMSTMYGSGKIVNGIIANNVPMPNIFVKIGVKIASFVINSMISDVIGKYTDEKIDQLAEAFQGIKTSGE